MAEQSINRRDAMGQLGGLASAAVFRAGGSGASAEVIRINPRIRLQRFTGWGTSLAWWAHVVGGFPAHIRRRYMEKIFHPVRGLGLNVARYNIGGGENPKYSFLRYRAAIPGFAPTPGKWDWTADRNQVLVLREAMRLGVNQVQAFSNSPPYYMTRSGSVTGGRGGGPNLREDDEQAFVNYLVEVTAYFRRRMGIRFQTLEAFNEPVSAWWKFGGWQEGCHIGNAQQQEIIVRLARALRYRGLATRIAAPDDNSIDETVRTWQSYKALSRELVHQIDTHSYSGNQRSALRRAAAQGGKVLWMSEYGDGDAGGMTMARRIVEDMRELRPAAWVYWQAVDGVGGWGFLANELNGKATDFVVNDKYHVMAGFSRFFRPGCRFIASSSADSLAAVDIASRAVVVAILNDRPRERRVQVDLSALGDGVWRVESYITSSGTKPSQNSRMVRVRGVLPVDMPGKTLHVMRIVRN